MFLLVSSRKKTWCQLHSWSSRGSFPSFSLSCSLHFYQQISQSEVINSELYLPSANTTPTSPCKKLPFPPCCLNLNWERLKVAYHTHSSLLSLADTSTDSLDWGWQRLTLQKGSFVLEFSALKKNISTSPGRGVLPQTHVCGNVGQTITVRTLCQQRAPKNCWRKMR